MARTTAKERLASREHALARLSEATASEALRRLFLESTRFLRGLPNGT